MINRRTFLATIGCAGAIIPLGKIPCASALGAGAKIETLHYLSARHPGFAYFAGLPGNLGMPFSQLARWIATDEAHQAFDELQNECDITGVIVGSTSAAAGIAHFGPYAAVARALGWSPSQAAAQAIAPHGSTLALTMPRRKWMELHDNDKVTMSSAARRMTPAGIGVATSALTPDTTAVDRVAEAVVADLANHDALTRRINAQYFAFKSAQSTLRLKNGV